MQTKSKYYILVLSTLLIGLGCTMEDIVFDTNVQFRSDQQAVDRFLSEQGILATLHPSGFSYIIDELGEGQFPHDHVSLGLEMTVYHLDSTFAFSTIPEIERGHGIEVLFDEVYWVPVNKLVYQQYLRHPYALYDLARLIKKDGRIRLFVPSKLGWGTEGLDLEVGNIANRRRIQIPANTNVLITATLVKTR